MVEQYVHIYIYICIYIYIEGLGFRDRDIGICRIVEGYLGSAKICETKEIKTLGFRAFVLRCM